MRIGTWSATGLTIYNNYNKNMGAMNKALKRISSGYRINSAADDAAGLAISEKMRAQIRGLNMASKNVMDGISLIQTAEGAMNETHAILQRMRELAVRAANDTNTDEDRAQSALEFNELKKEITRISTDTEFNTKKLLDGSHSTSPIKLQVGANAGQSIDVFIRSVNATDIGIEALSISSQSGANSALQGIDDALTYVSTERSKLGAYQNRLEHTFNVNENTALNLTDAESRIRDADIAKEMMNLTKASLLMQAAQYVLSLHIQRGQSILQLLNSGSK